MPLLEPRLCCPSKAKMFRIHLFLKQLICVACIAVFTYVRIIKLIYDVIVTYPEICFRSGLKAIEAITGDFMAGLEVFNILHTLLSILGDEMTVKSQIH